MRFLISPDKSSTQFGRGRPYLRRENGASAILTRLSQFAARVPVPCGNAEANLFDPIRRRAEMVPADGHRGPR